VKRGQWEFRGQVWESISAEAKDLVTKLMTKNVNDRLTAVDALAHPWIQSQVKTKFNEKIAAKAINSLSSFTVSINLNTPSVTLVAFLPNLLLNCMIFVTEKRPSQN